MANVQLQRQHTVTTTAVKQQQSQEVVQTLIHGGLSSLSYLREFFTESAFSQCIYGEEDNLSSYEDFAAGNLPNERGPGAAKSRGTYMQLLQRGKSRRVDKLLDWLEFGAFPAIKHGNLRALHVFVHADPCDRSHVIEAYTFTVKYVRDSKDRSIPTGIEVGKPGSGAVTVSATSQALQQLIRKINDLCENLPRLPKERYVSMALVYNDEEKIPDGWTTAASHGLMLGETKGWSRLEETFDDVFSGFHKTSFAISYLQGAPGKSGGNPPTIPDHLAYTRERPIDEHNGIDGSHGSEDSAIEELCDPFAETQFPETPIETQPTERVASIPTQSLNAASADDTTSPSGWKDRSPSQSEPESHVAKESSDTQSTNAIDMKEALLAMMQPEQITQGDTQSQAPLIAPRMSSSTTLSPSRGQRSPSARRLESTNNEKQLVLSQSTSDRLEQEKARTRTRARTRISRSDRRVEDVVTCQCGFDGEEGEMIFCTMCERWQHLHCYGFTGDDDVRIPGQHVCYKCLLGDAEPQTFQKLCEMAKRRRVMHIILHETSKKSSGIANSMQLAVAEIESIISQLDRAGFLVINRRESWSRRTFQAATAGPAREKMLNELFDPLMLISHHYQTSKVADAEPLSERVVEASALQMPPPATPASRLRRLTKVPDMGSPSSTPIAERTRAAAGTKRAFRDLAIGTDAESRAKRVQTRFLLDANGLPSSPAVSVDK